MDNPILTPAVDRASLARRIAALHAGPSDAEALREFARIELDFETLAREARTTLLGTSLTWSEHDLHEAAWLRRTNDSLAVLGYAFCRALAARHGWDDPRTKHMMARTLDHMGGVVKWEVAVTRGPEHDFAKPHALMRAAMAGGYHREPIQARFEGREVTCTLESLYFRALLLARFSSGVLNSKQIEILDAWMWMWMPALQGVSEPPAEGALRADLDSRSGLRMGPRRDAGPALYIPPGPIEEAYRHIVREFQAGRMVPSEGLASTFRIEEHVAVLELIRKKLRESTDSRVARAPRRETDLRVELHVGLTEVLTRGLCPAAPAAPTSTLTLATIDGEPRDSRRAERDRDTAAEALYERRRRMVRVANVSDTGLGLEAEARDCAGIAVGDVVALRLDKDGPLEICKVVRSLPAAAAGRTCIGVQRLSSRARPIEVSRPEGKGAETLLYVPLEDRSGAHDACLVTERAFTDAGSLEAELEGRVYTFRFNRPRDRGRGWVLAGFEITGARAAG